MGDMDIHPLTAGLLILFLAMFAPVLCRVSDRVYAVVLAIALGLMYYGVYRLVMS
jgi:hypothetical protein